MSSDLARHESLLERLTKPCSQIPPCRAVQQADGILGIIGFGWGMLRLQFDPHPEPS